MNHQKLAVFLSYLILIIFSDIALAYKAGITGFSNSPSSMGVIILARCRRLFLVVQRPWNQIQLRHTLLQ